MTKQVKLNSGKYRHKVMFQKLEASQDTYGEDTNVWVDDFEARVGIFPLSSKDYFDAQAISNVVSHKVLLRYRTGVTSDMRFTFNGRIFNIIGAPINYQERNVELLLMCREIVQ